MSGTLVKHAALIAFTEAGHKTALRASEALQAVSTSWHCAVSKGYGPDKTGHAIWTESNFPVCDALAFIGATGIAVRSIAPYVVHKAADPAVLVIDEAATWCIPLLSGHLGGANQLAEILAEALGATAVLTTATDVNNCWAVDVWAAQNQLKVANPQAIKAVSSKLLNGETVAVYSPLPIAGRAPEGVAPVDDVALAQVVVHADPHVALGAAELDDRACLHLVLGQVVAGVGCRKGAPAELIMDALDQAFSQTELDPMALREICSIDLKADEPGLCAAARKHRVSFVVYTPEELVAVEGSQSASLFVQDTVGVDNVCERSALAQGGQLVLPKQICDKVTVALALVEPELAW